MIESGLVVNRASVHFFDEFHDGVAKTGITSKNSGLDGGSAAVLREEGRVEIEDAFGLEEVEDVLADKHTKGGENTV